MASRPPPIPAKKELITKDSHLVPGQIDAHGLCCHFVVTDGLEGTAVGGVDQKHDECDADTGHQVIGYSGVESTGTYRRTFAPLVRGPSLSHWKMARMISAKPRVAMAR